VLRVPHRRGVLTADVSYILSLLTGRFKYFKISESLILALLLEEFQYRNRAILVAHHF
jgi:hypothetical protein